MTTPTANPPLHPLLPVRTPRIPNPVVLAATLAAAVPSAAPAAAHDQGAGPLPRSAPEAQGVASPALLEFVRSVDSSIDGIHSLMLLRHGHVIAEGWWAPYSEERRHVLYSLSKSFASTAVGMAVGEGRLSVDARVLGFFPDNAPEDPGENLRAMRVRDLLAMAAGHEEMFPASPDTVSVAGFLAHPVPLAPGLDFKYNTAATFMQSAIVQSLVGEPVHGYLAPRLYEPLGIEGAAWEATPDGTTLGGYGLRVRTEDIAKFGQLYLQRGRWGDRQLVPATWVDQATTKQITNGDNPESDWNQGYGFQFWRCRHDAYRGDGAFGQYCIVMPGQQAVLAITSGLGDMQAPLDLVWDQLLPALSGDHQPLEPDPGAAAELADTLAGLGLDGPAGTPDTAATARVTGKAFRFGENETGLRRLSIEPAKTGDSVALVFETESSVARYLVGTTDEWAEARGPVGRYEDEPAAGRAAWVSPTELHARIAFIESPYVRDLELVFSDDDSTVTLRSELNVAFGERKDPELTGQAE